MNDILLIVGGLVLLFVGGEFLVRGADLVPLRPVQKRGGKAAFDALEGDALQQVHHRLHPLGEGREDETAEGGRAIHEIEELGLRDDDRAHLGRGQRLARILLAAEKA